MGNEILVISGKPAGYQGAPESEGAAELFEVPLVPADSRITVKGLDPSPVWYCLQLQVISCGNMSRHLYHISVTV